SAEGEIWWARRACPAPTSGGPGLPNPGREGTGVGGGDATLPAHERDVAVWWGGPGVGAHPGPDDPRGRGRDLVRSRPGGEAPPPLERDRRGPGSGAHGRGRAARA